MPRGALNVESICNRSMDIKVKMAVTFLVVAAVACVAFCTFVFLCKFTTDLSPRLPFL